LSLQGEIDTTFLPSAESTIRAIVLFPGDAIRGRGVSPEIVSLTRGGVCRWCAAAGEASATLSSTSTVKRDNDIGASWFLT
jgi:hypothetical protein